MYFFLSIRHTIEQNLTIVTIKKLQLIPHPLKLYVKMCIENKIKNQGDKSLNTGNISTASESLRASWQGISITGEEAHLRL